MKKGLVAGALTSVVLAAGILAVSDAPVASGHYSGGWYWSTALAEKRVYLKFDDIDEVEECLGFGKRIRRDGNWLYKHFDCFVYYVDDTEGELEVHVTGRRGLVAYD